MAAAGSTDHAADHAAYLEELRRVLRPAFCLHNFASPLVERHNKPVLEVPCGPELVLPPVTVARSEQECALVERGINSCRVSLRFRAADPLEEHLLRTFLRFMVHRADDLEIVRRQAVPGYHLTFLVTWRHVERYRREALVDFVCQFVADLYAELSAQKLALRSRSRAVVAEYWATLERRRAAGAAGDGTEAAGGVAGVAGS